MFALKGLVTALAVSFVAGVLGAVPFVVGEYRGQTPSPDGAVAIASCATDDRPGDQTMTCGGLRVDLRIPEACPDEGCGLILVLHGDTGTGLLEDAHVRLRERGAREGYVVVAPTGPPLSGSNGST